MSKIKQYQEDPIHEDIRNFQIELAKKFPNAKPTSIYRPGAKTKAGGASRHGHGEAIDYSLKNKEVKEYLWNTTEGISLLNKYNLGLLDESEKGNQKWGSAVHIGKDSKLVENAKKRYLELNPNTESINIEVSNLHNPIQSGNFASVADVYVEPKEETKVVEAQTVKEQPKENPLMQRYQAPEQQAVVQEEEQYTLPELTDVLGMFSNVSSFIDNPLMQKGGTIYVNSKNDPRYRAYQDSLRLYNQSVDLKEKLKPYFNTDAIKNKDKVLDILDNSQVYKNYDKTKNKPVISPINVSWSTGKPLLVNTSGRVVNNSSMSMASYPTYKKPKQQVVVKDNNAPQYKTIHTGEGEGRFELIKPIPQVEPIQSMTTGVKPLNSEIEAPIPNIVPQGKIPTSFDINYSAQRMNGATGYYDQNNQLGVDIQTALRAKEQADRQNQFFQNEYGNSTNPEALKRLQELKDSVTITPNYQLGGKLPPVSDFYKGKKQDKLPTRAEQQLQLLMNETELAKQDREELNTTGQIKRPRSLHYQKLTPKQQPTVSQDKMSVDERQKANKAMEQVNKEQLGVLERPLIYLASPDKVLGDIGIPGMDTSEEDRQKIMLNRYNPYQSNEDRIKNTVEMGLGYVPEATVNTGLAMVGMENPTIGRLANEVFNPLVGTEDLIKGAYNKVLDSNLYYKLQDNLRIAKEVVQDPSVLKPIFTEIPKQTREVYHTFLDRNKPLYKIGAENLDKSLANKVAELQTEEGFSRLANQELEITKELNPYDRVSKAQEKAKLNAEARIEELKNTENVNKSYINAKKEYPDVNVNPQLDFNIPRNNAHFQGSFLNEAIDLQKIDLSKINKNYVLDDGAVKPGKIAIGKEFAESIPVYDHEINHAIQNGRQTKIDKDVIEFFKDSENVKPNLKALKRSSNKDEAALSYLLNGSKGKEPSSFLAELRTAMKERGLIKNTYDEITPEILEKAKSVFTKKPYLNKYNGSSSTRILDIANPTVKTYEFLSQQLNKLPALAPIAGASYLATQGQEEQLPIKQDGGVIEVKPSKIAGNGVFTKKEFSKGDIIGLAHTNSQPSTDLGKYHNHSENPNTESILVGNNRYLSALRPLKQGEEITTDYRKQPELEQPEDFKISEAYKAFLQYKNKA